AGSFAIQPATTGTGARQTVIAATGLSVDLSSSLTGIVTGGQGILVILPGGLAGQLSGTVHTGSLIPGASLAGTFGFAINQTSSQVSESVTVGTQTVSLDLPAGFLGVSGTNVQLLIAGQTLSGNFSYNNSGGTTKLIASDVMLNLGAGGTTFVSVTGGQGTLTITPNLPNPGDTSGGLSGSFSGDLAINVPGIKLAGSVSVAIDTTQNRNNLSVQVGTLAQPATLTIL